MMDHIITQRLNFAQRLHRLLPSFYADLGKKLEAMQAQGMDVIRLDEGSPDMPPAGHILEALLASAGLPDRHGYQSQRGSAALRQAWAGMYRRVHVVDLNPESQVLPLLGSKEGVFLLSLAMVEPGDLVLVPDPGYPSYSQAAAFAGAEPVPLVLREEQGYLPDLEAIPVSVRRRAKLLWLNYPSNPTAATASRDFFAQALAFAQKHGIYLCHDAVYSQVTFDGGAEASLLEIPGAAETALELNSLSKLYNMAGWRVGVLLGNPQVLAAVYRLKTHADNGQFLPIMEASVAALNGDQSWVQKRNQVYRQRRDIVMEALDGLGLHALTPRASLYVWFATPAEWDSRGFVRSALEQARVSLVPGVVFGAQGEGWVRLALTTPTERIAEAMQRLRSWLRG